MGKRLSKFNTAKRPYALLSFALALITAAALFVPFIIYHGGIFFYLGDFNVQEIPFYQLVHDSVLRGELGWSHITDLGSDLLSSYSFYLLGSPFFWLTMPFPSEAVPYLIGPLLILKFACASLSAYLYLKRYVSNPMYSVIGGLLYAFSGFSVYNVFFFHFHEPMIMFPLLLASLDAFIYDRRRGVFALAVFSACVVNYYFFAGQVVFVIAYFLVLSFSKVYRFKFTDFLLLAVETLIGFFGAAFMLFPSVLGLLGNPRLNEFPRNWTSLVHNQPQRYWLEILAFFFPSDMPAMPVFTPESNCKWASVAGWLPLFGMTGVIAFLQLRRRDWLKKLITLLILFAMVPVLNSMFQLMNSSIFYTRWFYMPVLMMTLATLRAAEDREADWNRAIAWSAGITAALVMLIGLMPSVTEDDDGAEEFVLGVQASFERFWIYALFALASLLALVLIYKKFGFGKKRSAVMLACGVVGVSLFTSYFIIGYGSVSGNTTKKIKEDIINARDDIEIVDLDSDSVRIDSFSGVDNTAMFWQVQSINCFQSSVSPSIIRFYDKIGYDRSVGSRPDYSMYGIRALLSCKYFFDNTLDNSDKESDKSFKDKDDDTKMPYWSFINTQNNFDIYENDCYIPMGFCFDSFVTEEEFELNVNSNNKSEAILSALVLDRSAMKKYADITGYDEESYKTLYGKKPEDFESKINEFRYGYLAYREQCEKLKQSCCDSFKYTETGFEAVYDNKGGDNLLFFSVPYSEGFTAFVNGKEAEIVRAHFGFMAVKVPAEKKSRIVFNYETPGFATGSFISLSAFGAFAVYMACIIFFGRVLPRRLKNKS